MKTQVKKYFRVLFVALFAFNVNLQAQNPWNPKAPMNPTPLKYTTGHFEVIGAVKTIDNMNFNKQGHITDMTGIDQQTFTFTEKGVNVSTNEYTFVYTYNEANMIETIAIEGMPGLTTYSYDNNGNIISVIEVSGPNETKTVYTYDDQNRVVSQEFFYGYDSSIYTYEYFEDGEDLEITEMMDDDRSSLTTYYYKNGIMYNYKQMGTMQREDIKYDSNSNWIEYLNPISGETETRTITYY